MATGKVIKSREFVKGEDGNFVIKETRDIEYEVRPMEAITNLKNLYAEVEKMVSYYKRMVMTVRDKLDQYNEDLSILEEAKKELEFDVTLPEHKDEVEELGKLNCTVDLADEIEEYLTQQENKQEEARQGAQKKQEGQANQ